MKANENGYKELFDEYLKNQIELRIVNYYNETHPIGGKNTGLNFDTGEVHSFDIEIKNKGDLGIVNMALRVRARRGRISGSFSGFVNLAGSHWIAPWYKNWLSRKFNLKPKETVTLKHEVSGGSLFGYALDEPTQGSGGRYETEDLLTAEVALWQPDIRNLTLKPKDGPVNKLTGFIQRN